jgi:hypothetical protein
LKVFELSQHALTRNNLRIERFNDAVSLATKSRFDALVISGDASGVLDPAKTVLLV